MLAGELDLSGSYVVRVTLINSVEAHVSERTEAGVLEGRRAWKTEWNPKCVATASRSPNRFKGVVFGKIAC